LFLSKDDLIGEFEAYRSFMLRLIFAIERDPVRERDKIGDNFIFDKS
jgi:hypothetical protein